MASVGLGRVWGVARALTFACVLTGAFVPQVAFAQQQTEYERLIDEAVAEFQAGHWREARALFERAHDVDPNARTLRGRGMAEFELRHYANATRLLRAALNDTRRPLSAQLRDKTTALLERARGFVGHYTVTLQPATGVLAVDGEAAQLEPDGTILLDVGEHTLSASAPGYASLKRKLDVRGGEAEALALQLEAASAAEPVASTGATDGDPEAQVDADEGGSVLGEWWFWTAVVAVAAGTTVAVIVLTSGDDSNPNDPGISTQALVRF